MNRRFQKRKQELNGRKDPRKKRKPIKMPDGTIKDSKRGDNRKNNGGGTKKKLWKRWAFRLSQMNKNMHRRALDVPLTNGRPAGFLKATRGLRQGCPLSQYSTKKKRSDPGPVGQLLGKQMAFVSWPNHPYQNNPHGHGYRVSINSISNKLNPKNGS